MARLNLQKLEKVVKNPKPSTAMSEAVRHHERLRLHVENANNRETASPAIGDFLAMAERILPQRTYARFEKLMRYPLPTNKHTKKIFADLKRVFDGKNRVIKHQFKTAEAEAQFEDFKQNVFHDDEFWQEDVWESIQTGINNFIVVDMAIRQDRDYPVATAYIVQAEDVLHVEINRDNEVEIIAYRVDEQTIMILDEDYWYVFVFNDEAKEWQEDRREAHGLGEVPAKPIWSDYMHPSSSYVEKIGPISNLLADLDEIVFWEVANRNYQLFGAFPIYWEYKFPCPYKDEFGNECDRGQVTQEIKSATFELIDGEKHFHDPVFKQTACPLCEANNNIIAGTVVSVGAPESKDDPNLREPMGMIPADQVSLEFGETKQNDRIQKLFHNAVGISVPESGEQAKNPQQVGAGFEDKKSILFGVKRNVEIIHQWTLDIMARLMFGRQYVRTYVNYGDEFYLRSEAELVAQYAEKRASGMPSYMLQADREMLMETMYRTNPRKLSRIKIMQDLEPYPDYTVNELLATKNQYAEGVNPVALLVKMRFSEYIAKFERENISILEFGKNTSYRAKIEAITKAIFKYAEKEREENIREADSEAKRNIAREPKEPATHTSEKQSGKPNNNSTGKGKPKK